MKYKLLLIVIFVVLIFSYSHRYYFSKFEIENNIESIETSLAEHMNSGNTTTKHNPNVLEIINLPSTNKYVVLFQIDNSYGHGELIKGINGKFSIYKTRTNSNLIAHDEVSTNKNNYFIIYGKNQNNMTDKILIKSEYENYNFTANIYDKEIFLLYDEIPSSIKQAWPFHLSYYDKDGNIIHSTKPQ